LFRDSSSRELTKIVDIYRIDSVLVKHKLIPTRDIIFNSKS